MSDDQEPILEGSLQQALDADQLLSIEEALKSAGFQVDVNFPDARFTVTPIEDHDGEVQLTEEYEDLSSKEVVDKIRRKHTIDGTRTEDEAEDDDPAESETTQSGDVEVDPAEDDQESQEGMEEEASADETGSDEDDGPSIQEERADNIRKAKAGRGWMELDEIRDQAFDGEHLYHLTVSNADGLADEIEKRPHPDDGRKKQYRLKSDCDSDADGDSGNE